MTPLFSSDGEAALARVLAQSPLLAFDFDGTLAPIVPHPDDARVAPDVARRLAQLAARCPLAIVTGRRVDDVRQRLGFEPRWIVGNHGAEDPSQPQALGHSAALDGLRERLRAQAAASEDAGVSVEDKGASLALHYRLAPDPARALLHIEQVLANLDPRLSRFGGKCVVNVVGAEAPDKADAVMSLVRRCGAGSALFVGDDVNDEAVFERAPPHWVTVRIGVGPTPTAARFVLDDVQQVARLVDALLRLLGVVPD